EIVWGEFHYDAVTRQHANVVLAHAATEVPKYFVSVLQFHGELSVRQGFLHHTIHSDRIRICAAWSGCIRTCGRLHDARSTPAFLLLVCFLGQMPLLVVKHENGPGR